MKVIDMIDEKNKDSWCVNAFHSMSANNDGSTKMCCMIDASYNKLTNSSDFSIGKRSIKDNFNNIAAKKIRENLKNGIRDKSCSLCWQEEDSNRKSKRLRDNEKYLHGIQWNKDNEYNGIAKFELNLGNTCNIKCRTCGPAISSQWLKEEYDLKHKNNISFKEYSDQMKKYHQNYDDDSPFWIDIIDNLPTIRQFDFYGGEPFLSKKMWEVLKICVDNGYSKQIELHYATNGTTWPDEIELWKNFKSVNLSFSIDGFDDKFEYMRYLANWETVKQNMEKALLFNEEYKILNISWCVTLSSLNIYYLPEILDVYYSEYNNKFGIYLNLVHGPDHFNISLMHPIVKKSVIEKLEKINPSYTQVWYQLPGIIGFIRNGNFDKRIWESFITKIKTHDMYRDQDFFTIFKEFGEIINAASVLE